MKGSLFFLHNGFDIYAKTHLVHVRVVLGEVYLTSTMRDLVTDREYWRLSPHELRSLIYKNLRRKDALREKAEKK